MPPNTSPLVRSMKRMLRPTLPKEPYVPFVIDQNDGYAIVRWHPDNKYETWCALANTWSKGSRRALTEVEATYLLKNSTFPTLPTIPQQS